MGKQWWEDEDGLQFWREEQVLVMRRNAEIPCDRCVMCNEPASGAPVRISLSWSGEKPPVWMRGTARKYFMAVDTLVRASAVVSVGLCRQHRRVRTRLLIGVGVLIVTAVLAFLLGAMTGRSWLYVVGAVLVGVGAVAAAMGARLLTPEFINDDYVCVSGVAQAYLDQVPRRA